ncbi:MAG: hypothetical protein P1P93_08710, partial [Gammaproteobacteria bacterium]|nr:hypothetical protein [Gammaproteobacteria bacterium]
TGVLKPKGVNFKVLLTHANDFEIGLTIWENIESDYDFIKKLRKHAGIPYEPANSAFIPETGEVIDYDEFGNEISDPLFENK